MANDFGQTAIKLARNPLGILALLIVLVYAIAGLVSASESFTSGNLTILVWFLVTFPIIVLFSLIYLVTKHHNKLYAPSDFENQEHFVNLIHSQINQSPKLIELSEDIGAIAAKDSDTEVSPINVQEITDKELISEDEINVLVAMRDGKHTYRSVSGISTDAQLDKNKIRNVLYELKTKGLLSDRDRGNGLKYFLNDSGRRLLKSHS